MDTTPAPIGSPEPTGPRIPTIGKAQPPYQFCYPIGAAPITEAFLDLPQFPDFLLSYSTNSPLLQPHWKIPGYPVLRLTYSSYPEYIPRSQSVRPRRQGGTRWQIDVLIVPKPKREPLQPIIIETGLPLLREWITSPDGPKPDARRACAEVWWFEDTGVMKLHIPEAKLSPQAKADAAELEREAEA